MPKCIFCGAESIHSVQGQLRADKFTNCPNCGKYEIFSDDFENHKHEKHLIAGYLYEFNRESKQTILIDFEQILSDNRIPKSPMQRLERLLLNLYKASDKFGELFYAGVGYKEDHKNPELSNRTEGIGLGNFIESVFLPRNYPISIAYARNFSEIKNMLESLHDLGYLKYKDKQGYIFTPKGFEYAEQLLSAKVNSKSVFVAMDFGNDDRKDGGTRAEQREIFEKAIKPACKFYDFDAIRIDDKPHINGITDEIIIEIKKSRFVIVDLTYNNNGAYWEAGYAQGLGRPVIYTCSREWIKKGNKLHFDINHIAQVHWESLEHFKNRLENVIGAIFI